MKFEWNKEEFYSGIQRMTLRFQGNIDKAMIQAEQIVKTKSIPSLVERSKAGDGGQFNKGYGAYTSRKYVNKRRKRGLQTGHKDLCFTGSLWDSLKIRNKDKGKDSFILEIGFTGSNPDRSKSNDQIANYQDEQLKRLGYFSGNSKIIAFNKEELEQLQQELIKSMADVK